MNKLILIFAALTLSLASTACSGVDRLSGKNKYETDQWITQKKQEQQRSDELSKQIQEDRKRQKEKAEKQFYETHPEVPVEKMTLESKSKAEDELINSLNNMGFVTRHPESEDASNVYMNVGSYKLSLWRVKLAISEYGSECKRVSAYSGADFKSICISNLAKELSEFSEMSRNDEIPDKTKLTALSESSYNNYINFGHAARLAAMHVKLCKEQGNAGYVAMVTVAPPCSGIGDVYNLDVARRIGVLQ